MLHERLIVRQSLAPAAYTVATYNGTAAEMTGEQRSLWLVNSGANGSSGTVDVQIQAGELAALVSDLDAAQDTGIGLDDETNTELGVSFTTPDNGGVHVHSVVAMFKRVGTIAASKNITCTLQADDTDTPDDTDLVTPVNGSITATALSSSAYEAVVFTFATPVALAADTKYWAVFEGDWTPAAANNVLLGLDTVVSGGNVNDHTSDWQGETSTTLGRVNVLGVDFTDVTDAASTQITEANDNSVHLVECAPPVSAGSSVWMRAQAVVGTATCTFGVDVVAETDRGPITQTNAVVSV